MGSDLRERINYAQWWANWTNTALVWNMLARKNLVEIVFWFKTYFESSWAWQYKPVGKKLDKLEGSMGHELHCEVLCDSVPEEPKAGERGCHCREMVEYLSVPKRWWRCLTLGRWCRLIVKKAAFSLL